MANLTTIIYDFDLASNSSKRMHTNDFDVYLNGFVHKIHIFEIVLTFIVRCRRAFCHPVTHCPSYTNLYDSTLSSFLAIYVIYRI